jgi:hypothetical protein
MLVAGRNETLRRCLGWGGGKNVGDLIMDGKKPLHLPWRLEPLHDPLSPSRRLVGIRPVVEAFVLAMLDAGLDLPLGRGIAFQFIGNQNLRRTSLLLQQFAQQAFGSLLVAPALDQDIENKARLVDRTREPVLLAGDADDDLIEVPFVATARRAPLDAVGKLPAELQAHRRIVSYVTEMPRAASISSTIRRLSGNRKYSQTA